MIIEQQTGKPFDEVFERELLDPVGASRASIDMGRGGDPTTVAEYMDFGTGLGWTNHNPIHGKGGVLRSIIPGGAGGLVASAGDLAKYAEALLWKRGTSVTPKVRDAWLRSMDNKDEYGYGLYKTGTASAAAPDGYGHDGRTFGSIAHVEHIPRTQQTIAALTNGDGASFEELVTRLRAVVREYGFE